MEGRDLMSATPMEIGMNLDQVNDYTPNWIFTDAFQHSRNWISHSYNTVTRQADFHGGEFIPVQTDGSGWPTQLATWTNAHGHLMQQRLGTLMFRELDGKYPAGTYRAEWRGTGDVRFGFDAREVSRGRTADGAHFALLNVTPGQGGIYLAIDAMSSSDPIRDVHVWMPEYNGQSFAGQRWQPGANFSPFHPLYQERLRDFGILRFMQTQETNTSDIRTWADRRDAQDARQASGSGGPMANGMSVEYMVQLANELNADPWFSMPHMANDDFVRNFATYVRDHLEPDLTAYVEWSNEIWNSASGFEAYAWIAQEIQKPENSGITHWQFAGREAARDMDILTDVFAGQTQRIVRTAAGQAANAWVTERILENMNGRFDAIAIAPYYGPTGAQRATYSATTTVDQVLADLRANVPAGAWMTVDHHRLADDFSARLGRDIDLIAYEGGPHLDGRNAAYQNAFYQATKDPRMADIFRDYLRIQNASGLDAYVHYKLTDRDRVSPYGLMGVLLSQDQPIGEAHLYRALLEADAGTLFTSSPTLVTVNAGDPLAHEADSGVASFRLTRGGNLTQPLTVRYTVSGTATAASDYAGLSGTVTFPANEKTALITVVPINDSTIESNETVVVTLRPDAGYNLISAATSTASITIVNDDFSANTPVIQIVASDPVAAEAGRDVGQMTLTRSGSTANALTVYLQTGFQTATTADYDAIPTSVTFAAGQASASLSIRPTDDTVLENTESVILSVRPSNTYRIGGSGFARVDIVDNEVAPPAVTPLISIAATDPLAAETNNDRGVFTLTRSGNLNRTLVVRYTARGTATGSVDYTTLSGFAAFAWGQATTTITVNPIDDPTIENPETIIIQLIDLNEYDLGTISSATVTLHSNEVPPVTIAPTVTIMATDATAAESNREPGLYTIQRTGATTAALTVYFVISGSATNGVDYDTIGSSITIPAGQTSATISLRPMDDIARETDETVTLTLVPHVSYSVGTPTMATVTISDNDTAVVQPVLMVISNHDFYYREYAESRAQLEAAGIPVVVAAGRRERSLPHANSGQGAGSGEVMPDLALSQVNASHYSAILFVGGWGASQYQYAFPGVYTTAHYNSTEAIRERVNQLVNDFANQGKYVTAICHGVSVLAWARVNNDSLLRGRRVSTFAGLSPTSNLAAAQLSRWHADVNGATVWTDGQVGNPVTATDDVIVDGQIITAENYDSARLFGQIVASRVLSR